MLNKILNSLVCLAGAYYLSIVIVAVIYYQQVSGKVGFILSVTTPIVFILLAIYFKRSS